jgi:hypothetical protein
MKFRTRALIEFAIEHTLWLCAATSVLVTVGIIAVVALEPVELPLRSRKRRHNCGLPFLQEVLRV